MKNLSKFLIGIILSVSISLSAQDDANCGIVINGGLADSITCLSFDNMHIVFPVKPEFKKYKTYTLRLYYSTDGQINHESVSSNRYYVLYFSTEQLDTYFSTESVYGVWKFMPNKTDNTQMGDEYSSGSNFRSREGFFDYVKKSKCKTCPTTIYFQAELTGYNTISTVDY